MRIPGRGGIDQTQRLTLWKAFLLRTPLLTPAGGYAGGILGLDHHLGEIDVFLVQFAFGELEAVLELGNLLLEHQDAGLEPIGPAEARDLGVTKLALEGREEEHRVSAAVGPGDLPLALTEEASMLRDKIRIDLPSFANEVRRADEDPASRGSLLRSQHDRAVLALQQEVRNRTVDIQKLRAECASLARSCNEVRSSETRACERPSS